MEILGNYQKLKSANDDLPYKSIWECHCGNSSFLLTDNFIYCAECGGIQYSELWEYTHCAEVYREDE